MESQKSKAMDNYSVNLKEEKYKSNYEKINRIFDNDYLSFIKKVEDNIIHDIYVLLRKYQYFFNKLSLNQITLFDFKKSGDIIFNMINELYKPISQNIFKFEIKILPKYRKSEINFIIPDDIFECSFIFSFNKNDNGLSFE